MEKPEKEKELSSKQLLAINHLLSCRTIEEASRKAEVSRATIYKWKQDESFKTELKRQRDSVIDEALNYLKTSTTKAVGELVKLLDTEREEVRRLACNDILGYALKSLEIENLEQRLDKVERVILEKRTYK